MKRYRDIFKLASDYLVKGKEEIINGVGIPFAKNTNAQALAHILQGYERQVLDAIIKHSNKDDIALLLHDCVVFYNRQDPKHLSDIVEKETGFTLQFSEELYWYKLLIINDLLEYKILYIRPNNYSLKDLYQSKIIA